MGLILATPPPHLFFSNQIKKWVKIFSIWSSISDINQKFNEETWLQNFLSTMDVAFYKVDKAISIYDALGE